MIRNVWPRQGVERSSQLGLDEATRARLLASLDRDDHRPVVLLAALHALSRTDIVGLRLNDVDLPARTLTVRRRRPQGHAG